MVKPPPLLVLLFAAFILIGFASLATAQIEYHLNYEYAEIWINQDGTIDLLYNMSVACDSGTIHYVNVGQPTGDFTIGYARDSTGQPLTATDTGDSRVRVDLQTPISNEETAQFSLLTNVGGMIWESTRNASNADLEFVPTWYDAPISDLRLLIVLPPGVSQSQVGTLDNWNNTEIVDGRFAVFWERYNLSPNQKSTFGVSFPKQYVQKYGVQPTGLTAFFMQYGLALFSLVAVVAVIGVVVVVVRKKPYLMPKISMETLGIRHGLTAVEASHLLEFKPARIVTEILYSLLQKRAVWVESAKPSLKLKLMKPFENKTGTRETPLRYYEIDFLEAIKEDGTLDEERLAGTVIALGDAVEEKMRGYCRRDTVDYYKNVVAKAWQQVEQAGTPDLASTAYDEQLLWLLLDPAYQSRTETVFHDRAFEPNPAWLWFWFGYTHYSAHPAYRPNVEAPAQAAKPPMIPGADFANNIASAVEGASNNIVANLEKFANAIVGAPPSARASHEPAHQDANCVCACHACACACACVSCACACAGGGVG